MTTTKNKKFSAIQYQKEKPQKAKLIKKAVKRGVKEYAETFKWLSLG